MAALLVASVLLLAAPMKQVQAMGLTFGPVVNLSDNAGTSKFDSCCRTIVLSGTNVYTVWTDFTLGNQEVFFRASSDNGATFGPTINLSNNAGTSFIPEVAVSGSNVYVVWTDETFGNREILLRISADNGGTFAPAINLSNSAEFSGFATIAISGNNVYVVWVEDVRGIFFRASSDNGDTFAPAINLSSGIISSILPEIAVSGNNVYVAWMGNVVGGGDIFFKASNDNGGSFGPTINLSTSAAGLSGYPKIGTSGNNVYVVWNDSGIGQGGEVVFRASKDNGLTFGSIINLSDSVEFSHGAQVSISDSNVYVAWSETASGDEDARILLRASSDSGDTFGPAIDIGSTDPFGTALDIDTSESNVYVVWADIVSDTVPDNSCQSDDGVSDTCNFDIFFKASKDNGVTFDPTMNLSNNPRISFFPQITASGSNVYVVWNDLVAGNSDLFLRVGGPNIPPLANSQSVITDEDTAVLITLTGSDPNGNVLTFSVVTGPASGVLSGTAPNLTYTPNTNFFGFDSFTFRVNDGMADSNVATVFITVNAEIDVIPFNQFEIKFAKISFNAGSNYGDDAGKDAIRIRGAFMLDNVNGNGVNINDGVTLTISDATGEFFKQTIKMKQKSKDIWKFKRSMGEVGGIKEMIINFKKEKFQAAIDKHLEGISNLVMIALQIGDDEGEKSIGMDMVFKATDSKKKDDNGVKDGDDEGNHDNND